MRLLTNTNDVFLMENLPMDVNVPLDEMNDEVTDDDNPDYTRYCVLDFSDPQNPDFFFVPLIFWESYDASAISIEIGRYAKSADTPGKKQWETSHAIMMPMDWHTVIGDPDTGQLEVMSLKEHNNRSFRTPVFNPLDTKTVLPSDYMDIRCRHNYHSVSWAFPNMGDGRMLVLPLEKTPGSPCVLLTGDMKGIPTEFHINDLLG